MAATFRLPPAADALDDEMKAIVKTACAAEAAFALAEMERLNIEALATLTTRDNAQLRTFPADIVAAARTTASDVLGELAAKSDRARKVHDSYTAFRDKISAWSHISIQAVLEARTG